MKIKLRAPINTETFTFGQEDELVCKRHEHVITNATCTTHVFRNSWQQPTLGQEDELAQLAACSISLCNQTASARSSA